MWDVFGVRVGVGGEDAGGVGWQGSGVEVSVDQHLDTSFDTLDLDLFGACGDGGGGELEGGEREVFVRRGTCELVELKGAVEDAVATGAEPDIVRNPDDWFDELVDRAQLLDRREL